jgi:hypothetical protein
LKLFELERQKLAFEFHLAKEHDLRPGLEEAIHVAGRMTRELLPEWGRDVRATADPIESRGLIGIGGRLATPPSHTTGHTAPYHGGSTELCLGRRQIESGKTERLEIVVA